MRRFVITLLISLLGGGPIWAEGTAVSDDFKFKRVKPPKSGASKRITVQIDPDAPRYFITPPSKTKQSADGASEELAKTAAAAPVPPEKAAADLLDWYWTGFSPALAKAGPGRLEAALKQLNAAPGGNGFAAPRLQTLQEIASAHGIDILKATIGTEVSPALALAVISVESGGRIGAVSTAGATGLMQLMPATAERFGVTDITQADQNIKGGVAYLDFLMKRFDHDPAMVLAAYNAGENSIKKHQGVPPYAETRAYVPKVLAAWSVAKGLCLTPPQLLSDGCVFNVQGVRSDG